MLPGPTNVPERILRAMYVPMINHRSDDFVELYEDCVEKTKKVFMTEGEAVCLICIWNWCGRSQRCKPHKKRR